MRPSPGLITTTAALAIIAASCAIDAGGGDASQDSGADAPCLNFCSDVGVGALDDAEDAEAGLEEADGGAEDAVDAPVDAEVVEEVGDAPVDVALDEGGVEDAADVDVGVDVGVDADVDADADVGAPVLLGSVTLVESRITTGTVPVEIKRGYGSAMFIAPGDLGQVPTLGTCVLRVVSPDAAPPFGYDAGAIEVSGVDRDFALLPAANVQTRSIVYSSTLPEDNEDMFNGMEPVTVEAEGGVDVGAFSVVLIPPATFRVMTPNAGSWLTGQQLEVGLNNTSDEPLLVSISPLNGDYTPRAGEQVQCLLEGGSERFTLPLQGLQLESTPRFALTVDRVAAQVLQVGASAVQVNAVRDEAVLLRGGGL